MARPQKEGLDYFPHDVYAASDEKIETLVMLYGAKGYAFYFMHLEYIYRKESLSFQVSDAETRQIICNKLQILPEEYEKILQTALKYGCFDKEHYDETGELTSNGVKKRAEPVFEKRKKMAERYQDKKEGEVSAAEIEKKPDKVKESKVKKRKEYTTPLTPQEGGEEKSGKEQKPESSCPHQKIIEAYHEILPECPRIRVWPKASERQMAARWRESKERQSLEWWRHVFSDVSQSDFLMGRTARDGPFVFSLGWFVKPTNFAKVLNGNYANKTQAGIKVGGLTF